MGELEAGGWRLEAMVVRGSFLGFFGGAPNNREQGRRSAHKDEKKKKKMKTDEPVKERVLANRISSSKTTFEKRCRKENHRHHQHHRRRRRQNNQNQPIPLLAKSSNEMRDEPGSFPGIPSPTSQGSQNYCCKAAGPSTTDRTTEPIFADYYHDQKH
ncbi:hypothetical protein G7046_g9024 [Stylonectria norvegica]|nr:hypothetical protein G7046_g9024 [Stylonectria norvegica]